MGMTIRTALLAGIAIGAVGAVVLGKERVNDLRDKAKDLWQGPQVQSTLRKADRFVADKAPTLHGVGEAVVDAASGKESEPAKSEPASTASTTVLPGSTS